MFPEEDDVGELYNIEADPDETRNLYAESEYQAVVQEGRRLLLEWLIRTTRVSSSPVTKPDLVSIETGDDASPHVSGRKVLPCCSDGRAPNSAQAKLVSPASANYL